MKRFLFCSVASFAVCAAFADPAATVLSVKQVDARVVKIDYTLSGGPAIVTADIQTNGVSIGGAHLQTLSGDVNCLLGTTPEGKSYSIYWFPADDWGGCDFDIGELSVRLTAWEPSNPPLYMAVDLRIPNVVWYYPDAESIPGGHTNNEYKTNLMLFRRIPAKNVIWAMGTPESDNTRASGAYRDWSKRHLVKLTNDYYIGVYELTADQKALITKNRTTTAASSALPAQSVTFNNARGTTNGAKFPVFTDGVFDYAQSHAVDSGSLLYNLRDLTGLAFDLPTEAQWEYACRAGAETPLYKYTYTQSNMQKICRCGFNKNTADSVGKVGIVATVGTYEANAFGLYDMLGNVMEWCLDWHENWGEFDWNTPSVNPVGPATGTQRQERGGYYDNQLGYISCGMRNYYYTPNTGTNVNGVRFVLDIL